MKEFNRKGHWEKIYQTKELNEVSWYQPTPETSLKFIEDFKPNKADKIIDIGGGDSFLVDHLLERGYENISVLDISEAAIERAKKRLGVFAEKVTWIVADAAKFSPTEKYTIWHDRAAFHFLTEDSDIEKYIETASAALETNGKLVIATFSLNGPLKCSGIEIKQYSEKSMTDQFSEYFSKLNCVDINHKTPFDTIQNFVFCSFELSK